MLRAELFFLLFVMAHNSHRVLTLTETSEQHGAGTQCHRHTACHSSLFPALKDSAPGRQLRNAAPDISIITGTYFEKILNATVELPDEVNRFDSLYEGNNSENASGMRRKMLPVVNHISRGEVSSREPVSLLYTEMQRFFEGRAADNVSRPTKLTSAATRRDIKDFQEIGTFLGTTKNSEDAPLQISNSTFAFWLRLQEPEVSHPGIVATRMAERLTLPLQINSIDNQHSGAKNGAITTNMGGLIKSYLRNNSFLNLHQYTGIIL